MRESLYLFSVDEYLKRVKPITSLITAVILSQVLAIQNSFVKVEKSVPRQHENRRE